MHVGFYHGDAGTRQAGGIAVYTRNLAANLAGSHEVSLYTRPGGDLSGLTAAGVRVVDLPPADERITSVGARVGPLGVQGVRKVQTALSAARAGHTERMGETLDVLVTFQFLDDLLLSRLVDCPTAFGYHRFDSVGLGIRLREQFSTTETVFANSAHTADLIEGTFGYRVDAVVPPGVDIRAFSPDVDSRIDSEGPAVVFAGRFAPIKGIDTLLEACSLLESPPHLYLLGRGDETAIERRSRELGVRSSTTIVGEVPHRELPGYLAGADVFCLPSHGESFGQANLEAMACGTPVVTTDLPAIREYMEHGETGLLVDPGSPRELASALETLLADPPRRARMGRAARQVAASRSWEAQADRFGTALVRAIGNRPTPYPH